MVLLLSLADLDIRTSTSVIFVNRPTNIGENGRSSYIDLRDRRALTGSNSDTKFKLLNFN